MAELLKDVIARREGAANPDILSLTESEEALLAAFRWTEAALGRYVGESGALFRDVMSRSYGPITIGGARGGDSE